MNETFTIAWIVIGLAALFLEITALLNPAKGDTLSENVWKWLRGKPLRKFLLGAFLFWLLMHFLTEGMYG